jgi:hypothetical protein
MGRSRWNPRLVRTDRCGPRRDPETLSLTSPETIPVTIRVGCSRIRMKCAVRTRRAPPHAYEVAPPMLRRFLSPLSSSSRCSPNGRTRDKSPDDATRPPVERSARHGSRTIRDVQRFARTTRCARESSHVLRKLPRPIWCGESIPHPLPSRAPGADPVNARECVPRGDASSGAACSRGRKVGSAAGDRKVKGRSTGMRSLNAR